ncbi:hypothetical protein L7F22_007456 [Adiantum nelumboides]|nr:hypothetical protein [Adiantum nelumboides]
MTKCQNFFDDQSPSVCKSSSSTEQQSSPGSSTIDGNAEGADHHLELRLGPSVDVGKAKQHQMVRPIPLYPSVDRQRSGNYCNATSSSPLFRGRSDASLLEKALFSKDSAFSTPPIISREQVWQTLQNTNAAVGQESGTSKPFCDDAASSKMGKRSASMQLLTPSNEMTEVGAFTPLRRSCSNGILLSRQSSFGQESLVDESPDAMNSLANCNQQDVLEHQKKKEMQAHRRLEARKRRRLILDKQQKKARQNSGLSNRQSISPVEKASLVRMRSFDAKYALESKGLCEGFTAKLVNDDIKRENRGKNVDIGVTSPPFLRADEEKCDVRKECESRSSGSKHMQGDLSSVQQMIASCDLSAQSGSKEDRLLAQARKMVEIRDPVKILHSSCSETESTETKEKEAELSERESSSQKSSTENHLDCGVSSATNTPSKPMLYPRTSPVSSLVNVKVHTSSSHCQNPHFPPTKFNRNEGSQMWQSSQCKISELLNDVPSNFSVKKSVGVFFEGKWRIPDEDSASPPIRRTASNIIEVVPEPHRPAKLLETYASLSASQLKFAGMAFDNVAWASSTRNSIELEHRFLKKSHPHAKELKKELDVGIGDGKASGFGAFGSSRVGDTFMPHRVMTPIKVKQEEDAMDDMMGESCFSRDSSHCPVVPKMEVEPIKRQRSESFSKLPRVTTTGRGPNGRTINGVMYIAGGQAVRLVCRCHGKHMSPAEFVEHAGSTDLSNPLRNIKVDFFPRNNHLASTPV